ncbi:MAG: DUF1566 domain-containing protein [Hyphomicrobiales bacterium]|nr:DUF1566 domain-containing protein [Hyphomicrobiales bacterium]
MSNTTNQLYRKVAIAAATILAASGSAVAAAPFPVPDTLQQACFDDAVEIACPSAGEAFYGQDAQHEGTQPSYADDGDETVTDNVTGLMWAASPDLNGDGDIDIADKRTYDDALTGAAGFTLGGYDDWRLPTIKEMYSLMDFRGIDPSGYQGTGTAGLVPFIDTDYFGFGYGDTRAGERIIDAQLASSTLYTSGTGPNNDRTMFGVNFADGRIKGYGLEIRGREKTFYVMYVRGDAGYGVNDFFDNDDGTVTDAATGLMWAQDDSGVAMDWPEALAWVQAMNAGSYLGHNDWRLPNVKELQSLVDYDRSPESTGSAAIDPIFATTEIVNEAGQTDFPGYWSSTTHKNWTEHPGRGAAYVNFGRSLGYIGNRWVDIHGAGAQRSDPKVGDPTEFPTGHGPQGDAIRIDNYARLVRDAE